MEISKVGVLGAGLMGHGIAQVTAEAGYDVVLREVDEGKLEKGIGRIEKQLARAVEKGKAEQSQADEVRGRIQGTLDYDDFGDCELVVEAITESLELKVEMWKELDGIVKEGAVLATNTSSLSVTEMAEATSRPEKVCGFHFFWPASVMRLIEVIEGEETSEETLQAAANFAQAIRKTAIRCGEVPGFVVNRILISSASEVWRVTDEEDLDPKEVDKVIKDSGAIPMGPFFLADLTGLDVGLHTAEHLRDSYGDRFYVSAKMKELVEAGHLGQKTGEGFYEHG